MPSRFLAILPPIALLGILCGPAAVTASPDVRLDVGVRYLYGDWRWGAFKMNSEAGMAGPQARLAILGGRWAMRVAYLTGDFAAVGAIPLDDPLYHSRKNYAVDDRRETFDGALEFRPLPAFGAALVYRFARYEHTARIVLDSDQRAYGEGLESTIAESSAWGLAARSELPPVRGFRITGELAWFPRVHTESSGRFAYTMSQRADQLDERWYDRFSPTGLRGVAEVNYAFNILPATLSAGYLYERFDDDEALREDWLTDYLAGGAGRDLRQDLLQGVTLRAGFRF
jgi:hypothetical protein